MIIGALDRDSLGRGQMATGDCPSNCFVETSSPAQVFIR